MRYLGRFMLPVLLLAAAIGSWIVADRLSTVSHDQVASDQVAGNQVLAADPMLSIRRLPEFAVRSSRDAAIASALGTLPTDPGGLSCVVVLINGVPVLQQRSDRALMPSYAQLMITGHAAIDILGPEFRYETQVLATSLPDLNGRIFGGVYLVGGGDPVLMSHNYAHGFRPTLSTRTSVEDLAARVAEADVVRIDGGVIAIERRYDEQRSLPGWSAEFDQAGIVGPLTALQLDDGFQERATANLGVGIAAEQPAVFAAERFVEQLSDIDVQVFGTNRVLGPDEELPSLVPVARISSAPLADIVLQMLAVNDATAAELLMKELGFAVSADGSTQAGARAVQQVLQNQGLDLPVPFRSGSGLDPIGGTSCDQLAAAADTIADGHPTLDVLPRYGLPGVFDGRFADLDVIADLRLVGGIQGEASGFVARTVGQGDRVTIASIINRPGGPSGADLAYQEALVELVDQLRLSINFDDVASGS